MNNVLESARKHFSHLALLALFFILGVTLFMAFAQDPQTRLVLLSVISVSYAAWNIVHHYVHKDLTLEITIEYCIISLISILWIVAMLGWNIL